ncbi:MAG: DUF4340 domain-containing protein [Oscillospiraceae bacterium]|jgi:hypothetical protein|nr:DUF4340 domain-containing protein [Oscillospiraceae bacterium]
MKDNTKILVISFCCAAVLLAGFICLKFLFPEDDNNKDNPNMIPQENETISSVSIIKTEIKNIKEITIKNQTLEFKIESLSESNEPDFRIENLEKNGKKVSKDLVKNLFEEVSNFSANKIVSENLEDFEKYDLKQAKASITINFRDSTSKTLLLGANTAFENGAYLRVDGENKVYVISLGDAGSFSSSPENYSEKISET